MFLFLDSISAEKAEEKSVHFQLSPENTVCISITGYRMVLYFWRTVWQSPGVASEEDEELTMNLKHETVKYCFK